MIANAYLNEWRQIVPWSDNKMVEQDLVISRLLVELFNHAKISDSRAMFEMNFAQKLDAGSFSQDISPLLSPDVQWNFEKAAIEVFEKIIPLIPGKKWKSQS